MSLQDGTSAAVPSGSGGIDDRASSSAQCRLDPVLFAVISGRMKSIAEEMAFSVMHSARSPLIVEGRDFSVGIFDAEGYTVQQIEFIPLLGFAVAPSIRHIAETFLGEIYEGDVFIHNDVYTGAGQLGDVKVARPVFFEDELIAWTSISAHQADVGGAVAGGYNPDAKEVWQEALRILPVKLYERGKKRKDVWNLIFGNVRLGVVAKDIEAAIGGCIVGEREMIKVISKYGAQTTRAWMEEILEVAERLIRAEIARMPRGRYHGSAVAVYDGITPGSILPVEVEVTVEGAGLILDFEGTAAQSPGYVNAPLTSSVSAVMLTLSMILGEDVPRNDGLLRAVDIRIPSGSFLNPKFPAATGYGNHISDHIFSAIMNAFENIRPQDVIADWTPNRTSLIVYEDPRSGATKVTMPTYTHKGGSGAVTGADGYDHMSIIAAGGALATTDPEMVEIQNPHFILQFELNQDSGGPGRWRGGLGTLTVMELLWPPVLVSFYGDGDQVGTCARGILGGWDGAVNELVLEYPDGRRVPSLGKGILRDVPAGTLYRQSRGGGGGCGDPRERDRSLVIRDVVNGFISQEAARKIYGLEQIPTVAEYHRSSRSQRS